MSESKSKTNAINSYFDLFWKQACWTSTEHKQAIQAATEDTLSICRTQKSLTSGTDWPAFEGIM